MAVMHLGWTDVLLVVLIVVAGAIVVKKLLRPPPKAAPAKRGAKRKATTSYNKVYTRKEIAKHNRPDDCWLIIEGKVYDVTPYVEDHVGGVESISKKAGYDNTEGFLGPQHPLEKVQAMVEDYLIGVVAD